VHWKREEDGESCETFHGEDRSTGWYAVSMPKHDAAEVLSRVSGLSKEDVRGIWKDVQANHARLEGCDVPHDFQPVHEEGRALTRQYRCTKCGGTLRSAEVQWYFKGLDHAMK